MEQLLNDINKKYTDLGERPEAYLKGLFHAKPITYWDYIEVETLLSLQKPRTDFKDEKIFILYHQVTELVLKLIYHEIEQIVEHQQPDEAFIIEKLKRCNRYTEMLITSFDIMKVGMNLDDYNQYRHSLTPASGFQSAQFRYIEICCTPLKNLIHEKKHAQINEATTTEALFELIYWQDAGTNPKTGKKSLTLQLFIDKYMENFVRLANKVKGNTVADKVQKIAQPSEALIQAIKDFDKFYNIDWPMVHLNTARHYLIQKGEAADATGGSDWQKYLHPQFQRRKFFPFIYSKAELDHWGKEA